VVDLPLLLVLAELTRLAGQWLLRLVGCPVAVLRWIVRSPWGYTQDAHTRSGWTSRGAVSGMCSDQLVVVLRVVDLAPQRFLVGRETKHATMGNL
jgi:hypothetical protein